MYMRLLLILLSAAFAADAAEFVVTNLTGSLNDPATYENSAVPGADDVIVWPQPATNTLDATLAVKGLRTATDSVYKTVGVSGEALSIGADGVTLNKGVLSLECPVLVTADQTWNIVPGGNNMYLHGTVTGPDCSVATTGNGNLLLYDAIDVAELAFSNPDTYLRASFSVSPATRVTIAPQKFVHEDTTTDRRLTDMLSASALTNVNGVLELGRHSYNPQAAGVTLALQAGERIANTVESSSDRSTARLDFGGHVLENDGGEIDMRWCYAYTGAFRQRAGRASFFYDFVAGIRPEDAAVVNNRPFEFLIEGGTLSARRMEIGCASGWSRPTRAVFAGGTTLLTSSTDYAGVALATANGPAVGTSKVYGDPDARMEVTGDAVVKARGVWLGTYPHTGAANYYSSVTNGYGEILLTGGTLYVGTAGIRSAPARWAETADGTNTWATLRMAGGRLGSDPGTGSVGNIYLPVTFDGTDNVIACGDASGAGHDLHLRGPLLGDGGFVKTGSGALRVYGPHVATGKVTVSNGTLMYYNAIAEAEVVRTEVEVPAATFGWTADALAGDAGTAVTSWAPTNVASAAGNTFNTGSLSTLGITAPTISATAMNGHRTLAFDAAACTGIGMGGSNAKTLLGSPTSMTWLFVFRTPTNAPVFNNDGNGFVNKLSALFSRTYSSQKIAALLRTDGCVGLGIRNAKDGVVPFETVWAPPRDTRFNDAHVFFFTWDSADDSFTVTMDGYTQSGTLAAGFQTLADAAITIGMLDHCMRDSKATRHDNHFTGEIAEIRYYKNEALTVEQRAQIGRELAERYGAPTYGYLTVEEKTNAVGLGAREYEIQKTDGAVGGLKGDHELYLGEGQRIWGSGNVNSGLTLRKGAILDMAHPGDGLAFNNSTAYPPNTHGLTLDGGAVVRFASNCDGVTSAPTTTTQLTLRGTNVIRVVSTDEKPAPRDIVFQARDSITVEADATFTLEGVDNSTRVVVDPDAKTVRLETSLGTAIIFR
ncbi:MAG: hypothetical protein IJ658_03930 [Kiritimatiellae bacterium]|nr:hypothetical protein [Kiritimatiellia bacterium]